MPPKRTTRSSSVKPPVQPLKEVVVKRTTRPKSKPLTKRASSPERSASPPPKRRKAEPKKTEVAEPVAARKPRSRTASVTAKKPIPTITKRVKSLTSIAEAPAPIPQQKPYFNPLPTPIPKQRPGLQLFVWGAGNFGQFGMGPDILSEITKPRKNAWVEEKIQEGAFGKDSAGFETIAAGGLHSIFVDENGTVWTCGVNDDAALGRVTKDVPDPNNPGSFLDIDELTSIPHPLESLVTEKFRAVKVCAGDSISAAISAGGELRVWGSFRANEGALGFASGLQHQFLPTSILDLPHKPGDYEKVVDIAAGVNHLLVLTTHGNLYTWGAGEQSQLGRKVLERRKIHGTVPEKITLGSRTRKAVVVGAGHYHSFAVDNEGDIWGWGLNSMGQTGTGYNGPADAEVQLPKKVEGLSKSALKGETVVKIAGGDHHTLFLTSDGKVYACGRSNAGQLGLPDDHPAFKDRDEGDFLSEPTLVPFPDEDDSITHISVGAHNNMAVSQGGALYAWGQGIQGELGVGDESEVKTPRQIVRKEGGSWTAVDVACGGQHTLGLFRKKT
jgi:regulator of chromosome condensation